MDDIQPGPYHIRFAAASTHRSHMPAQRVNYHLRAYLPGYRAPGVDDCCYGNGLLFLKHLSQVVI